MKPIISHCSFFISNCSLSIAYNLSLPLLPYNILANQILAERSILYAERFNFSGERKLQFVTTFISKARFLSIFWHFG